MGVKQEVFGTKKIRAEVPGSESADAKIEAVLGNIDSLDLERQKKLNADRYEQDTKERKLLSHWVVVVVSSWLFLVFSILLLEGFSLISIGHTVLCVLLGTTTVNILGLAYIVLRGLFPESKSREK
jgi:type IV secretory pathway TrbL component